jgi:hypothetical protein
MTKEDFDPIKTDAYMSLLLEKFCGENYNDTGVTFSYNYNKFACIHLCSKDKGRESKYLYESIIVFDYVDISFEHRDRMLVIQFIKDFKGSVLNLRSFVNEDKEFEGGFSLDKVEEWKWAYAFKENFDKNYLPLIKNKKEPDKNDV